MFIIVLGIDYIIFEGYALLGNLRALVHL